MFSQVSVCPQGRGVSVRETPLDRDPPYTITNGRYASYWNVFLFVFSLELLPSIQLMTLTNDSFTVGENVDFRNFEKLLQVTLIKGYRQLVTRYDTSPDKPPLLLGYSENIHCLKSSKC